MSIDVLRGFDMLLIIFADKFFFSLNKGAGTATTGFLANQFEHPDWFGFHIYDIVMPLFLFVVGVVIPFSMEKRIQNGESKIKLYSHIIRRFVILFILGWIVQGHLLDLDLEKFAVFSNTLQAIAVGYLFSTIAYMHLSKNNRYILFVVLLIVYAALLALPNIPNVGKSELLPDKSFAIYIDRLVFRQFDDGTQYTWLITGLGFTATTLSGLFAGELLKSSFSQKKILQTLIIVGVLGIIAGQVWGIWHPIIKKLWTSSFVLFLSGICYLLLAFFYWIIDIKNYRKWAYPLNVIGTNAITAYVISHVLNFSEIAKYILFGFEKYLKGYYEMVTTIGGFGIIYILLLYMYKNKTVIKV